MANPASFFTLDNLQQTQLRGLFCFSIIPFLSSKPEKKHGKGVGSIATSTLDIKIGYKIVGVHTSRRDDYFIYDLTSTLFYWVGASDYVIDPKGKTIKHVKTNRPLKEDKNGSVTVTMDNKKRTICCTKYLYESLLSEIGGV
jgi:hypothetical protein